MHLYDIHEVLVTEEDVDENCEPPLINIEKWDHLKETAFDALHYRNLPMEYNEIDPQTAMDYLQNEIEAVAVAVDDEYLQRQSDVLAKKETITFTESVYL